MLRKRLGQVTASPACGVHEARVLGKITRAGLRLFDPDLECWRHLDRRVQRYANALSSHREAEALAETADFLHSNQIINPAPPALPNPTPATTEAETATLVTGLVTACHAALDAIEAALAIGPTPRAAGGTTKKRKPKREQKRLLRPATRALRRALAAYRADPDDRSLHQLRKRTKRLAYQLEFFTRPGHRPKKLKLSKLKRAGSGLGRARDLAAFLHPDGAAPLPPRTSRKVGKLARRTRKCAVADLRKLLVS